MKKRRGFPPPLFCICQIVDIQDLQLAESVGICYDFWVYFGVFF